LGGVTGVLLGDGADVVDACRVHAVVVAQDDVPDVVGCLILDAAVLARSGTVAVNHNNSGLHVTWTEVAERLWSPPRRDTDQ
jgi:hypothetical protein